MGLGSALNTAMTGLGLNQRQLSVTADNIANADTVGYTRKSIAASAVYDGNGRTIGVYADTIKRSLDTAVQSQYWSANAQTNFASIAAQYTGRLDQLFGSIDDPSSISNTVNNFNTALSNLVSAPENYSNRLEVNSSAESMALKLNSMSNEIQSMRQEVEFQIEGTVDRINQLLTTIQDLDKQIVAQSQDNSQPAGMLDERDRLIEELSGYMDVKVSPTSEGGVRIMTESGLMLYDVSKVRLDFDARSTIGPNSQYDMDPSKRGVGTISLVGTGGNKFDLIGLNSLRSGSLAGLVEMRDETLVDAQGQLDEMAASVARAFSTHVEAGTNYPAVGVQTGFEVDFSGIQPGDNVSFSFKDLATGATKNVTLYDDGGGTPPGLTDTSDPGNIFLAVDFSSGTLAADIQAALDGDARIGAGALSVAVPAADTLRLETANAAAFQVESAQANVSATGLEDYADALPMFVDEAGDPFTGMKDGRPNVTGFASVISVNKELLADPSKLVEFSPTTGNADTTRPEALLDKFSSGENVFNPSSRIGAKSNVYQGSIQDFAASMVSFQSGRAAQASSIQSGQQIVSDNLKTRVEASSEVNLDEELGRLIQLENAYAANARVMQVVQDLFDVLMRA